ncbi:DUF1254 domain-containing protein [Chakrabartia godavariana]|nr:DUF1254 domain-containing protein [Chakrabartia godavariana]
MKQWIGPAALALLAGAAGWHAMLSLSTYGLMEGAIRRVSAEGGLNLMRYGALATPENQPIVRPSPDLAYSTCPYDLSNGPVEVTVTPVPGRYSSLSIFDARTDVVFVRNDQQAQEKPYRVVIAREGQAVPTGAEVVRVGYDRGIALIRLLLNTPAEIKTLDPVRRQSSCRALPTGAG